MLTIVAVFSVSGFWGVFCVVQGAEGDEAMMDIASLDAIYSVQKMAEVLVAGPDTERVFILFELQQLLDHCLDDTMKILLPVLCENVPTWNIDLQIKSAQRLYDVVILDLDAPTANMITCASFGVIHNAKGKAAPEYEELYNLWGSILVECLPNMRWTAQEIKDVIALVDIHAKETLYTSRKIAARVIGALAQCLDKTKVEKMILPRALQLFDDSDIEVRGMVVESLAQVGASLPIRVAENEVWPRLERLLEPPEEARLRATAMRTMAHVLESHRENSGPSRLFRDLLPPVFARLSAFARKFSAEDQRLVDDDTYLLLEVASEIFGQFSYSLALFTRKNFRKEAYKAYAGMATCNGPLIRRNCAFNLPGVAKALGERYSLELSGLCEYLAKDTDEEVRWILAAGIHETTALLAPRGNFERLFTAVCSLLQDENPMVRMNALGHFHDLLTAFAKDGTDPASVRRLAPVFQDLTMLSEGEWRIQKSLAEQLAKCADIIPADALMDHVLPLLYRLTKTGTPLVREAAMDAVARSLRNIPSLTDRNSALEKYWKAAGKGPFWMRLSLLDGGTSAMGVFSHRRFAELFSDQMLVLANDPVVNVRIRLATVLSEMAPMCMGSDSYKQALETLQRDEDVDVRELIKTHDERVKRSLERAKDETLEDQNKYREEQEFYGFAPRAQKRARGRLSSTRGNRIKMHVRRPSLEQSSGQLSVSKAVITAAKASSAAASQTKPAFHPKLPPADSAVYLGVTMENVDEPFDENDPAGDPEKQPTSKTGESILTTLARSEKPARNFDDARVPLEKQRSVNSRFKEVEGSVPVVQKTMGKPSKYEARSKSWNGILAQLPRQLSMESRSKKKDASAKDEDQSLSGWGKHGKDSPKKTLSSLGRRRRKKRTEAQNMPSEGGTEMPASMSAEEFGIAGPRVLAARAKSINAESSPVGALGMADFASMGSMPGSETVDASKRSSRGKGKDSGHIAHTRGSNIGANGVEEGRTFPVVVEKDSDVLAFKGSAPWKRAKTANEDLEALSDAAHRKAFGIPETQSYGDSGHVPARSVISSFHNSASKVFGGKSKGGASTANSLASNSTNNIESVVGNTASHSGGGGGGFFRALFRRRR